MGQNTNQKDTFFFLGEKATTSKIPKEKGRGLAAGHWDPINPSKQSTFRTESVLLSSQAADTYVV